MKKIGSVKEYVEALDSAKKVNPKDLSSDQDLTIGIMNLISIEEHLMFSGAKTGKTEFYDMINDIRDLRKRMMQKIIPAYEGEVWCISKHLLAAAMRLFEVGTKAQAAGDKQQANELFDESYSLYCIFWGLNMGMLTDGAKMNVIAAEKPKSKSKKTACAIPDAAPVAKQAAKDDGSTVGKLKNWVKNAVNCCIE